MDGLEVLDLSRYKKVATVPATSCLPLDLRTTRIDREPPSQFSSEKRCHYSEPSLSPERSRWNHRSHPSLDSDSSFESEQENEPARCRAWVLSARRESVSTDTDNEREALGFYKELPVNDTESERSDNAVVFQFTSCEAEVLDAEELIETASKVRNSGHNGSKSIDDDDDEDDEDALHVDETATYIEELLQMQLDESRRTTVTDGLSDAGVGSSISAGIQETATKCIKEIQMTKKDLYIGVQNLQGSAKKGKRLHCSKCHDEFHNNAALWQHLMTHSSRNPGEKLIKCPVCTKRFSTVHTLERHMLNLHTGEMKYVCLMCEAPFKYRTHLRKHMLHTRCGKGEVRKKKDPIQLLEKPIKRDGKKKSGKLDSGILA